MSNRRVLSGIFIVAVACVAIFACESSTPPTTTTTTTSAGTASGPDLTKLPLGDGKLSTTAKKGYVMRCGTGGPGGGGADVNGPWINTANGTFNDVTKLKVAGTVAWPAHSMTIAVSGTIRVITTNDLPNHTTGVFPIAQSDPAYQYDRNPNHISAQSIDVSIPATPTAASTPHCLTPGPIGVTNTGVVVFDALDALDRDAVAHEEQDGCNGHPDMSSIYHYHSLTACMSDSTTGNSKLLGYALDGYGIYGPRYNGKVLSSADLDQCHGVTSTVTWNGKQVSMYHYVATADFPYTISCFHGTPATVTVGST